jgi:CheY-like chemotaxis protein/DNA-binding XRE family transcriptional regulator
LEHNLTQQELAAFLGVSQKTVSRWERGADQPGPEIRKRLSWLLSDGVAGRLPDIYEAVRDASVPLALVDGRGSVLVASKSFPHDSMPTHLRPAAETPPTILVVEDDDAVLKATRALLKRWNILSVGAVNGEEALRIVAEDSGVLRGALIDFLLPGGLDGVDLANALQQIRPHFPVLIISGEATPERMQKISRSCMPFIAKPVDPDEVMVALLSLLSQSN